MVNYARWLVGSRLGLAGGPVFLALYWVFPTLAAFAGWNRGMVLLCLGLVTLAVLINLQNQALRLKGAAAALLALAMSAGGVKASDLQVVVPLELAGKLLDTNREAASAIVAFEPVRYQARQEMNHFRVEARVGFQVLRVGETAAPLFGVPVHLVEAQMESGGADLAGLVTLSNRLSLFARRAGQGTIRLFYRVPVEDREGKRRAQIPLVVGASGEVRLECARSDVEI